MVDAETYKEAASEHLTVTRELYDRRRYVLAHYVAGLSVECIFRAYRCRVNPEFDSRHDLVRLFKLARFADIVPARRVEAISAALGVVVAQWSNEHRFRSEDSLRRKFVGMRLHEGIRGNFMKEASRRILNAAADIVTVGMARWTR